jgi:hypothetical protein
VNRRLVAVLGVCALVVGVTSMPLDSAFGTGASQPPAKILPQPLFGSAALASITAKGKLGVVAAKIKKSEADVSKILSSDPAAGIDQTGQMFFVEPGIDPTIAATKRAARPAQAPAVLKAPFPDERTFELNSNPGAYRTIFLDFDGYTPDPENPTWGSYVGTPYDTDGDPTTFGSAELAAIQSIWLRVSEDFAPWQVNVTTQFPGLSAIDRADADDLFYGTTVAFAGNPTTQNPCINGVLCGGVAYIGVFDFVAPFHQIYQPAWVFQRRFEVPGFPGESIKGMAEVASHEAGHNLGLRHDACATGEGSCVAGQNYYFGHDNWAPIMGTAYYEPIGQWSQGEYLGANNQEPDLDIISAQLEPESDSMVDFSTAYNMGTLPTNQTLSQDGSITRSFDEDFFVFSSPAAKEVSISVSPAVESPNLDIEVALFDSNLNELANDNPRSGEQSIDVATGLSASITHSLPSGGNYYVRVRNAYTDPDGDTGYTAYGSIGRYKLALGGGQTQGDSFAPVPVSRLLDTRTVDDGAAPIGAGVIRNLTVAGVAGVPANASAVALNVAAVRPLGAGHLRVFPAGTPTPNASVLNFGAGKNTPNHVIVKVGANGQISIYAGNTSHVIVDVNGYWIANDDNENQFVPVATPTRIQSFTIPKAIPGNPDASTVIVPVIGEGGIPALFGDGQTSVETVALNIGAINPTATGHLRVFPSNSPLPNASTHNFLAGDSRMNLVLTRPSSSGSVSIYNASAGPLTITVDTVGWFQRGSGLAFTPINPVRPFDTRAVNGPAAISPPVEAGAFVEVPIRGFGSVPASDRVKVVVVNVAAVNPQAPGSIDVGPSGADPLLPSFTYPANENVANLVIVPIGADGKIRVRNNSTAPTQFIVDITGYFSS